MLIDEILEKYHLKKIENPCAFLDEAHKEIIFLNELIKRTKKLEKTGFKVILKHVACVSRFNDLLDLNFNYFLENKKTFQGELVEMFKAIMFLEKYFFINESWEEDDANLLLTLLEDNDLNYIFKKWFYKSSKELVRQDCFYYKDEVWKKVKHLFLQ